MLRKQAGLLYVRKLPHDEENFFKENFKKFFDDWEIRDYVELQILEKKNEKKIKIEKFKKKKNCRDKGNYENGIRKKQ